MKIFIVIDKYGSAIDRLAQAVKKYSPHLDIEILAVHPKRPDADSLLKAVELMEWCDIIDVHYWKSGEVLRKNFTKLFESKPRILFHFNPYDADKQEVNDKYDVVVVGNKEISSRIPYAQMIPYGIDLDTFKFNDDYTEEKVVNMTVARIEGKKGVREVAQACKELGYKFKLVGRVSKPEYMNEVRSVAEKDFEFYENVTDEKMLEIYKESAVHVCNSIDGFESGCYDDQTEILTDQGWKLFKDLNLTEKVATLNPETSYLEYQKPTKYITQNTHEELYRVDNRAISFAVTPNHNMWVAPKTKSDNYKFTRADELPSGFKIKRTCKWLGNRYKEKNRDWFRFLGIWLAEGSVYRQSENSCRISIAAVKPKIRQDIRELLTRMGVSYQEKKDQFVFSENQIRGYKFKWGKYLEQFGKAKDKFVPNEVLRARAIDINEFLDWYVKGDGTKYNGARIIWTSSKKMADGLQECFIKVGNHANIKIRDNRGQKRWIVDHWATVRSKEHTIYERVKKAESYVRKNIDMEIIPYGGKVYCVEVPNHILLVRRKGMPYFCGNTLPILESMATGIPVLTRNIGMVPDIYNGKNMSVRMGEQCDVEDLKKHLKELMDNRDWRLKMREKAWDTVRTRDIRVMVRKIRSLYNGLYMPDEVLNSIIIPTKDNPESFIECLVGALGQIYKKYEIVVADSGDTPVKEIVEHARKQTNIPIKYIHFPHKENYTLAEARNRAVIEAEGEWLLFCDDRIKMEPGALRAFDLLRTPKTWFWGIKDGVVKGFVENFSYVNRKELIFHGIFLERMQWYGGMSQEIRTRFEQNLNFIFSVVPEAKAEGIKRSKSKRSRREDIIEAKFLVAKMYD